MEATSVQQRSTDFVVHYINQQTVCKKIISHSPGLSRFRNAT